MGVIAISKNLDDTKGAQLRIFGPAPAGTESGELVPLGSGGLMGWALTDCVTQADLDDFTKTLPQGLKDGEASFELIGTHLSIHLQVDGAINQWAPVFRTAEGVYTPTATGNTKVGYALKTQAGAGRIPVALV